MPKSASAALEQNRTGCPTLVWAGKDDATRSGPPAQPVVIERAPGHGEAENRLVWGDNLDAMRALAPELAGAIDLVYIDPPFATGNDFAFSAGKHGSAIAYRDRWEHGLPSYLS